MLLGVPIIWNIIDAVTGADRALVPDSLIVPQPPADAGPEFRSVPYQK
jgi:hypothetical protein